MSESCCLSKTGLQFAGSGAHWWDARRGQTTDRCAKLESRIAAVAGIHAQGHEVRAVNDGQWHLP